MGEEAGPDALGKVGVGVRRAAAWVVVAGAAMGAVGTLAGCMEVGPAVAPAGAGVPTAGVAEDGGSQDGVRTRREGKHHPGSAPGAELGASASASAGAARPSAGSSAGAVAAGGGVGLPVAVTPAPSVSGPAAPTSPPAQSSSSPTSHPSPTTAPPTPSTPPPTPTPTPSTSASVG